MEFELILFFSIFGLCSPSLYNDRQFHFINLTKTWFEAQSYCREKYTDLATIESEAENNKFLTPIGLEAWIGLHDDTRSWKNTLGKDRNSWRWSHTGEPGGDGYYRWDRYRPNNLFSKDACVEAVANGRWDDNVCETKLPFACYSAPNPQSKKKYFVVTTPMTWKEAQTYCRTNYTDLALIENAEENQELLTLKGTTHVWIGLYRLPWRWSDNRDSSYKHWRLDQPDNYRHQYCTASDDKKEWVDINCGVKYTFWCQEVPKQTKIILKMKIHTAADLSDPTINTQLLQQIGAEISKQTGQANVNLKWSIQPKKEEEEEEEEKTLKAKDQCPEKGWQTDPPV